MCSQRTLIASPPFAPTILCQILRILLISLKSVNRPISSVTSHHVTLRTGGQASVCFTTWRRKRLRSVGCYPVILRVYSRKNQRKGIPKS